MDKVEFKSTTESVPALVFYAVLAAFSLGFLILFSPNANNPFGFSICVFFVFTFSIGVGLFIERLFKSVLIDISRMTALPEPIRSGGVVNPDNKEA
ncbi:hypothetical protein [Aeromonas hydrophila]|uniref:hypothetical protein n=1 Tax=Aeromonas hydrophila TaxID=644 RepID=UPI0022574C5B|nr:hypothetical protein [Aeromonas hydrophila]MCX4116349.1 hypothetical protein [Aeromonas hydrophila]